MSEDAVLFWRIVALVIFAGVMWAIAWAWDLSIQAMPNGMKWTLVGLMAGLCVGYFIGEREGRAIERRRAPEDRR